MLQLALLKGKKWFEEHKKNTALMLFKELV
jgi:hypothetical protein